MSVPRRCASAAKRLSSERTRVSLPGSQCLFCNGLQLRKDLPLRRSAPLSDVIPNLILDRTIEAGHNDLYDRKAFVETLRKALAKITGLQSETHPEMAR